MNQLPFLARLDQDYWLQLSEEGGSIISLTMGLEKPPILPGNPSDLLQEGKKQILAFLQGERKTFDLPINPQGSAFRLRVWERLLEIPYGQTRCYQEIAQQLGNPKAMRAIGGANRANPLPLIIPCHRVTAKDQDLAPHYSFGGVQVQRFLLELEKTRGTI